MIDHHKECRNEDQNKHCRQTVTPDVDTLVVNHKKASEDLLRSIEVNAVAMSYVAIFLHKLWSIMKCPDEMLLIGWLFRLRIWVRRRARGFLMR